MEGLGVVFGGFRVWFGMGRSRWLRGLGIWIGALGYEALHLSRLAELSRWLNDRKRLWGI